MQIQKRDIKVLISADLRGRFGHIVTKVTQLQAKNNFDFMLLLGQVCHPRSAPYINALKNGEMVLPLPLLFIDNSQFAPVLHHIHPNGGQIVTNLRFLGLQGVTEIHGLNIAYFGRNSSWGEGQPSKEEIQTFLQKCRGKQIDILMTNEWPKEVQLISQQSAQTADYVSQLACELTPHYHLAASGNSFYRMSPYKNAKGRLSHFICVAPCEEEPKDKYLFALTIKKDALETAPEKQGNFLDDPYVNQLKGESASGLAQQQRISVGQTQKKQVSGQMVVFFQGFPEWARRQDISEFLQRWGDIKHLQTYKDKRGGHSGTVRFSDQVSTKKCIADTGKFHFHSTRIKFQGRNAGERRGVQDCWFCKSNTDRALVVWWGRGMYISLEKGPLCRYHLQLIPYNHAESSGRLDSQQREELQRVRSRLRGHFSDAGYQVVQYQRCLPLSEAVNHCVIHLLPIKWPQSLSRAFETLNKEDGLKFRQWDGGRRNAQYFLEFEVGGKRYLREVQRRQKVQADFMRQLLCQLLDSPKLVSWKACERTPEQLSAQLASIADQLLRAGISTECTDA